MKAKQIIFGISVVLLLIVIFGCNKIDSSQNKNNNSNVINSSYKELSKEELNEIMDKASDINSFEFDYYDTDVKDVKHYEIKGTDVKVTLAAPKFADDVKFDTIYLNKNYQVAYSYCSENACEEKDATAEPTDFKTYDLEKPTWIFTRIKNAYFVDYEMFGNHNTSVIDFVDEGNNKGRMWIQNYYKIPLKINYSDYNGHEREIEYKNFYWDSVRFFQVSIPENVTLAGYNGTSKNPYLFRRTLSEMDFDIP